MGSLNFLSKLNSASTFSRFLSCYIMFLTLTLEKEYFHISKIYKMYNFSMQLIELFQNQHSCVVSARWERLPCDIRVSRGTPLRCSFRCSIPGRLQWHIYWNFMQISKLFTQLQLLGSLAREQDSDTYVYRERRRHRHGLSLQASPGARSFSSRRSW